MNHWYARVLEPLLRGPVVELVEFLRTKGVLKRYVQCVSCNQDMVTRPYSRNRDGLAFRCFTTSCINYKKYFSIRTESLLSNLNVPLSSILKVCFKWLNNHTQVQIRSEVNVGKDSIIKIIYLLRRQCFKYYVKNPLVLGGDGIIVQIDESLFRHK